MEKPEPRSARGSVRDRRRAPRQESEVMCFCRLLRSGAPALAAGVLDISTTGAGLLLPSPPDISGSVVLCLRRRGQMPLEVPARVVYVAAQSAGTALLGCEFATPLTEAELGSVRP